MRKIAPAELPLDHLVEQFKARAKAQRLADQHAEKVKEIDAKIKAELGESPYGTINGVRVVSYTTSERMTFDTAKFKENHGALYEDYRRPTTVRTYKVMGLEPAPRRSTRQR